MYKRLVLQGGGVKGIALVGALQVLEDLGVRFEVIAGASAGAIVGSLAAAGYSASELREILMALDFSKFLDGSLSRLLFWRKFGMHTGKRLRTWIAELLKKKGIVTFSDFQARGVDLVVVATNVTARKQLVFSGKTPDIRVADAVRMSASIPFFFEPIAHDFSFVVDGGILSNFPLAQLPAASDPSTIGLQLVSAVPAAQETPRGLGEYLRQLVNTVTEAHDSAELKMREVDVVRIDVGGVATTDFSLSSDIKERLYLSGHQACSEFVHKRKGSSATSMQVLGPRRSLRYEWPKELDDGAVDKIRCSMSGLVRIVSDNCYLLVRGQRIEQFQPAGGVFKYTTAGWQVLKALGATYDQNIAIDDDSRHDLRVYLPKRRLAEFLEWYLSSTGREVSPEREFREEVTRNGLLDAVVFATPELEWSRTHVSGIHWTPYFKCYEILVAEIFELLPNSTQEAELRKSRANGQQQTLAWVTKEQIETRGWQDNAARQPLRISEHSSWLL